ncbi:TPA: DinI family protein, partial [Escherichia coli]
MVVFFLKIPNLDFSVYLRPFYVPYMPHRYPA